MKETRSLMIEIECKEETCWNCKYRDHETICDIFPNGYLEKHGKTDAKRCKECLDADITNVDRIEHKKQALVDRTEIRFKIR